MDTRFWGPSGWKLLHHATFQYKKELEREYKAFLETIPYILPCKYCRMNLEKNFKAVPLHWSDMKDRYSFSYYIYRLHEHINQMLNKSSGLSYEDVRERYEHFRARCSTVVTTVEKGCTESLYGKKSKCVLKIVPQETKCKTFQMNRSCKKRRIMV
jgi:hypothetical protein